MAMNLGTDVRVSDIHLAAYLLVKGYEVTRIEGAGGRRELVFASVPPEAIASFYGGNDAVGARALLDAFRNIKGLMAQPLAAAASGR